MTEALEDIIKAKPVEWLRRHYATQLRDRAETDAFVRTAAKRVLSEAEVDGDSYGVPAIEDIVELLVRKIESHPVEQTKTGFTVTCHACGCTTWSPHGLAASHKSPCPQEFIPGMEPDGCMGRTKGGLDAL